MIAAIAFAVLIVFASMNLIKLLPILKDLQHTIQRVNTTIDVVTKDVDNLSIEVEGLLNKTNTLVDDVNDKLAATNPLFTAIGDLGESVSEVNDSTKQLATNLLHNAGKGKRSSKLGKLTRTARIFNNLTGFASGSVSKFEEDATVSVEAEVPPSDASSTVIVKKTQTAKDRQLEEFEKELNKLAEQNSSPTAGEVIKK